MSKFIIEIDENEEKQDLDWYLHRYEILGTLREIEEFRRTLYKGWHNLDKVLVREGKSIVTEEETKQADYDYHGVVEYVDTQNVIDRLDTILEDVYRFLI